MHITENWSELQQWPRATPSNVIAATVVYLWRPLPLSGYCQKPYNQHITLYL